MPDQNVLVSVSGDPTAKTLSINCSPDPVDYARPVHEAQAGEGLGRSEVVELHRLAV